MAFLSSLALGRSRGAAERRTFKLHLGHGYPTSAYWFMLFLDGTRGTLVQKFTLTRWLGLATTVDIALVASPCGMGDALEIGGILCPLRSAVTQTDCQARGHPIGEASGQQAWGTLCAELALRAWQS